MLGYNNDVSPIVVDLPQQVFSDTFIGSVTKNENTVTFGYNTQRPDALIDLPVPDLQDLSPYLRIEDDTFINNAVLQSNNELVISYYWQD